MKYLIKGELFDPIKVGDVGDAKEGKKSRCGKCKSKQGQYHEDGCKAERCPRCGGQLINCSCGSVYIMQDDASKEEIEYLSKLQEMQNIAEKLEIECQVNKIEFAYDADGEDGDVFYHLVKAKLTLEEQGKGDDFEKLKEKVYNAKSYDEAIQYIVEALPLPEINNKEIQRPRLNSRL